MSALVPLDAPAHPPEDVAPSPTRARRRPRGRWLAKLMKLVRRVHMYTGLLMFPWVLLFGLSGMLFNHPNFGESGSGERLDTAGPEHERRVDQAAVVEGVPVAGLVVDVDLGRTGHGGRRDAAHAADTEVSEVVKEVRRLEGELRALKLHHSIPQYESPEHFGAMVAQLLEGQAPN